MAAITSAADGTWIAGAATTWVGGIAPGEGDSAIIANTHDVEIDGNITVGADSTTAAIEVQSGGRLFVPSTVAGNYTLTCKGDIKTDATGGTIEFGTVANPIPNTRTFNLKLNYSATLSDGEFGLLIRAGGTFTCQGSKPWTSALTDPDRCLLAADAAANATSITVDGSTGWNANDRIAIAPTTRTYSEYDPTTTYAGQVSSSSGTTLNLTNFGGTGGGLLYAHSGTSPNQAEIINLTRNIVIENYDGGPGAPGNVAYVVFETTATVDVDWTEFRYLGTNAVDKYGLTIKTTSGACNLNRCAFHDIEYAGLYGGNVVFTATNNVFKGISISGISFGTGAVTITNNWLIGSTYGVVLQSGPISASTSFASNRFSGCSNMCIFIQAEGPFTIDTCNIHSNAASGIWANNGTYNITINNSSIRRNVNYAIQGQAANAESYTGLWNIIGTSLVANADGGISNLGAFLTIDDCILAGDASYSQAVGLGGITQKTIIRDTTFGVGTAHTVSDLAVGIHNSYGAQVEIELHNVTLSSVTKVTCTNRVSGNIFAERFDGVAGLAGQKTWRFVRGASSTVIHIITADTSYYATVSPSAKLTPSSATYKLESGSMFVPVDSGQNPTVTVKVRESASLNGNAPRLMVRRNDALGITADTVLDTATNGPDVDTPPGTFETLSGQPGAVSADGVLEFFVDVDGTAGYCNIDDWTVTGNIA